MSVSLCIGATSESKPLNSKKQEARDFLPNNL